ncbi:AraC family transcriptional regulator [Dokdonia pacifica]|uniref:Transcriptional regulator, AraC family n=1 Tax=Dokdonia pacifica TaxID=1627892 RepID=A0A239A0J1_9FLAO|nr:AraC family transcriptional regulator [Dokdonia pacifica]GGG34144.1 AraC family transcriptional regulator [Dokdonia pacifica]SNR88544.1 transcriptional regulator, AraC family [Dokdonia pacifica]
MKVLPFKIPKPSNTAIIFQIDAGEFYGQLHQHQELQISHILQGNGTLLIADTIHHFQKGDVFVIGGQQPHVFRSEATDALMHTVFFNPTSFGDSFLDLDEGKGVQEFYAFAKAGFKTTATQELVTIFDAIAQQEGLSRLAHFLLLIQLLTKSAYTPLSTFVYPKNISEADGKKLHRIFEYSLQHFSNPIQLEDIAHIAAMSTNGFCKYFKKRTNKTYFQFLTEIRITKACTLLKENPELSIAAIAELSGFQTLSHFNRKFKYHKKVSPSIYRVSYP